MKVWIQYFPLRIVVVLALIVMGVSIKHLDTLIFLLLYGLFMIIVCRVPFPFLGRRLVLALPFIMFSVVFFSLYESSRPLGIGWLTISMDGLNKALLYSTRLLFTLELLTLLFYQMTMQQFFRALLILKLPGIFVELILFTLRFMDVIRAEAVRMYQALRSRGMRQRSFYSLTSYRVLSQMLGGLLLRSLQRSERIYMGMMSRGYQGIPPHLQLAPLRASDWITSLAWVAPCVILFVYDIGWRASS
jgi:cobalt/nickel transport system permease protein